MSLITNERSQMRTLRWVLVAAVAVLVSCGGGSSSTQISPIIDCEANSANVDAGTPTLWDAAGYCWGADRKVIVDIIIEMNPHLDPMNLQTNQTIKLPIDNNRTKWLTQEEYILMQDNYEGNGVEIGPGRYKVGDTGPGGGIIVYVDVAGFDNSSGDGTSIGAMCLTGTCHYLEVGSPALREDFSLEEAIIKVEAFSTSSANDWLLPSDGALDVIFDWAVSLDELCEANYWSSPPEPCAMLRRNNVHDGDAPQFDGLEQAAYWTSGNIVYYGDAYSLGGYTCFALPVRAF